MNPILRKDLLGMLRLRRVAAIQVAFVAVLAVLVLATWPQGGMLSMAAQGRDDLLTGLVIAQLVLFVLFVPGLAAVSLTGEKEANTLEMLYASRLSPMEIIVGKVLAAVAFPAILLVSGLPFLAMLNWRGEVDVAKLRHAYAVLVLAAVLLAILPLTISAVCRQSATALVVTYVTILVTFGAVLVPAAIMLEAQSGTKAMVLHGARSLSPVAAVLSLLRPRLNDFGGQVHQFPASWQIFTPVALAVIGACLLALVLRLRRAPAAREGFGATGAAAAAAAAAGADGHRSLGRRVMFIIDPKRKPRAFGVLNPVASKEARTNNLRSGRWMIRIFYGSLFLSLGLAAMSLFGGPEQPDLLAHVAGILVCFQLGVIALVAPSLTAASVSAEVENGTFEMLRLTRLRGGQIFWGKFLPAFFPAVLPVLALLPGYLAMCVVDLRYVDWLLRLLPVVALSVAFCCTLGLCCSTFAGSTARATVAAYLITAAVFVLPLLAALAGGTYLDPRTAARLAIPSPLAIALNLLPDLSGEETGGEQLRAMWMPHLWFMGAVCVTLLVVSRIRLTAMLRRG